MAKQQAVAVEGPADAPQVPDMPKLFQELAVAVNTAKAKKQAQDAAQVASQNAIQKAKEDCQLKVDAAQDSMRAASDEYQASVSAVDALRGQMQEYFGELFPTQNPHVTVR